jgi:hypothetical protein
MFPMSAETAPGILYRAVLVAVIFPSALARSGLDLAPGPRSSRRGRLS